MLKASDPRPLLPGGPRGGLFPRRGTAGTQWPGARGPDCSGSNLFTISLDARGQWFRYHHLFQDLLRRLLTEERRRGGDRGASLPGQRVVRVAGPHRGVDRALPGGRGCRGRPSSSSGTDTTSSMRTGGTSSTSGWPAYRQRSSCGARASCSPRRGRPFFELRLERIPSLLEQVEPLVDEATTEPGLSGRAALLPGLPLLLGGGGRECPAVLRAGAGTDPRGATADSVERPTSTSAWLAA